MRHTRTRPGGLLDQSGQEEHADTHTHGGARGPPNPKGRCRRPHKTAPVDRPSPQPKDGRYGKPDASVTGATHPKHGNARTPRPIPEGSARDNPIAGPQTVTTPLPRRVPAGTKSPVLGRPRRAPRSRPVNPGAQAPGMQKGTTASGKLTGAPEATTPDEAQPTNAGQQRTPERHTASHNQGTPTGTKQQRPPGALYLGSAHSPQRTGAQEQVPGNTQPTDHIPQPGKAGYRQRVHTDTHTPTPQPGVAGRSWNPAQAHTHPMHTPARIGGVPAEHAHKHTNTQTPQPGVAGRGRNPSQITHTHTAQPSQEWRATSGARTQTHTHTPTPQLGVAGRSRNPSSSTHSHTAQPSRDWKGTSGARTKTHT